MSTDARGLRFCDDCGDTFEKATRVLRLASGITEFCKKCYKREFTFRACPECTKPMRAHRYEDPTSACMPCQRARRRCLRCNKPVPRAGLLVGTGAVCPECVPYFRMEEICPRCNQMSKRLARLPAYGILEPVCERCQGKAMNRTCGICRRYRPQVGTLANGLPFCADCKPGDAASHPCPTCSEAVAGGGNGRCRRCLACAAIEQEGLLGGAALERPWCRDLYHAYGRWLRNRKLVTGKTVKLMVNHRSFFIRLENVFTYFSDMTPTSILNNWKVEELRLHRSVGRFLKEEYGFNFSPQAKLDQCESDRLIAIRQRCRRESWESLITGYATWLASSTLPLRTQRLYLGVAEKFARARRLSADIPWGSSELIAYLRSHSGSRASLAPLAKYARQVLNWQVRIPPLAVQMKRATRYPRTVSDLRKIRNEITSLEKVGKPVSRELMERAIAKALGFTLQIFQGHSWSLQRQEDGLCLKSGK